MIANPWTSARRLARRPRAEIAFAAKAWLAAPAVEASLHVLGLRRTLSAIERVSGGRLLRPGAIEVERGAQLMRSVYARHALRGKCLPQSLVQYLLHRLDGRSVAFEIGVKPPGAKGLEAHAWVGEVVLAGGEAEGASEGAGASEGEREGASAGECVGEGEGAGGGFRPLERPAHVYGAA